MNAPKVQPEDYIDFLIASPKVFTATEAGRVQPELPAPPAHDAFTRLLTRLEPDPETLWEEAKSQIGPHDGVLVIDDSTLDKPYSKSIELVTRHWSGKHHAVVKGINLVSLLWTDGDSHIPCDYRVYDKTDKLTKNDHFGDMIRMAFVRKLKPRCVVFDGWYSSLENLKLVRNCGWLWLTRLKSNRLVNLNRGGKRALGDTPITSTGTDVWLPGYGLVKVFRIDAPDGDTAYWATNDLTMSQMTREQFAEFSWRIEHYHRGIKQFTGIERCQSRSATAQRNHIGLALRAFLRLEIYCLCHLTTWFQVKTGIIRDAVRAYIANPRFRLPMPPTA